MTKLPERNITDIDKGEFKNLVRKPKEERQRNLDNYMRNKKVSPTSSWTKA